MELLLLVGMIVAAVLIAAVAIFLFERSATRTAPADGPSKDVIEATLLQAVAAAAVAGGAGRTPRGTADAIDIGSWAEAYARRASTEERGALLERAAGIAIGTTPVIPLAQYDALLELAFGLGFHPDALARLRARYRFEYIDHAKRGRPRSADRAGAASLFRTEEPGERDRLLRTLRLKREPTRGEIVSAWRRLAAENHPDRFHGQEGEERERAAARFIEVTDACERLLILSGEGRRGRQNRP
jgi:hypothetical protein